MLFVSPFSSAKVPQVLISVSILFRDTTVSLLDRSKRFDYSEVHQSKRIAGSRSEFGHFLLRVRVIWAAPKADTKFRVPFQFPFLRSCESWIVQRDRCVYVPAATIVGYVTN
jgi:hypothetical protein